MKQKQNNSSPFSFSFSQLLYYQPIWFFYFLDMTKQKNLIAIQQRSKQLELLEEKHKKIRVNNGEIWRYHTGINIWNEVSFKRPCLVLKHSFWKQLSLVVPITTQESKVNEGYTLPLKKYPKKARLILNQCHTVDKKRFIRLHQAAPRYSNRFVQFVLKTYQGFLS